VIEWRVETRPTPGFFIPSFFIFACFHVGRRDDHYAGCATPTTRHKPSAASRTANALFAHRIVQCSFRYP